MKTYFKTTAQSDERGSYDSKKHSVSIRTPTTSKRFTFGDLNEARLAMLDKACEYINDGKCTEENCVIIPYTN